MYHLNYAKTLLVRLLEKQSMIECHLVYINYFFD